MCTIPGFYWHFKLNLGFPACTLSILLCLIPHLRFLEKASSIGWKDSSLRMFEATAVALEEGRREAQSGTVREKDRVPFRH